MWCGVSDPKSRSARTSHYNCLPIGKCTGVHDPQLGWYGAQPRDPRCSETMTATASEQQLWAPANVDVNLTLGAEAPLLQLRSASQPAFRNHLLEHHVKALVTGDDVLQSPASIGFSALFDEFEHMLVDPGFLPGNAISPVQLGCLDLDRTRHRVSL